MTPSETEYILEKMRKDAQRGRLLFVSTRVIPDEEPLICCPTATVKKRLPDRRWGEERRIIWDGRFGNLPTPKTDYYKPELPTIKDIADRVVALKKSYPHVPIKCTKRDINSALRQIRLHPDAASLFATEFHGKLWARNTILLSGTWFFPLVGRGPVESSQALLKSSLVSTIYHHQRIPFGLEAALFRVIYSRMMES